MEEIWKDLKGYEEYYKISNFGFLKRKARIRYDKVRKKKNFFKEEFVKLSDNGHGYMMVRLYPDYKPYYIHRLIAINFLPNPLNKEQVNHKNGNKKDNNINNLEWVTPKENMIHSSKVLKTKYNLSGLNKSREKQKKKVCVMDKDGNVINVFNSIMEASKEMNISPSSICSCCKGKRKMRNNLIWKYM